MDQLLGLYGQFINDYYSTTLALRLLIYSGASLLVAKTVKTFADTLRNK